MAGADVVLFDPAAGAPEPPPVAISRLVSGGVSVVAVSQVATPADAVVALAAGASGYVATRDNPTGLVAALDAVLAGERWVSPELAAPAVRDGVPALSNQERRAVVLYTSGLKLDSVARAMGVKPSSVKQYLDRVRAKYAAAGRRVSTRYDLTEAAVRDGLIPPPGSS
ncbi:MAG: response regulator transcription factor [Actinomycetota bacterium]|nr:MAG: response regulator transcription factor [Actinomycetota bacterium]